MDDTITVARLIELLQEFDPKLVVVTTACSSYCEISNPSIVNLMDKGGFLDHAYPPAEKWRERPFVYLGSN